MDDGPFPLFEDSVDRLTFIKQAVSAVLPSGVSDAGGSYISQQFTHPTH